MGHPLRLHPLNGSFIPLSVDIVASRPVASRPKDGC